jgi:hypothetical protein
MFILSIPISRIPHVILPLVLACVIGSASASSLPATELLPIIPGEPESRSTPFIAWFQDLSLHGYIEEEFSVTGFANIYGYRDDLSQSPVVEVIKAGIPYTSRMLLRRPEQPAKFSGTVFLEVLNATAGWDGDPIWQSNHEFMIRKGLPTSNRRSSRRWTNGFQWGPNPLQAGIWRSPILKARLNWFLIQTAMPWVA